MKILMVSMPSVHFIRWVNQLKDQDHEIFWFDILNGGYIPELGWVEQYTDWKYIGGNFKGRNYIKKRMPHIHRVLVKSASVEIEKILEIVKPDVVHSFALHIAAYPILKSMRTNHHIKWIYSSWGSDLYYHRQIKQKEDEIKQVIPFIDYYFSDCRRDTNIMKEYGFKGGVLGIFPGGGGYKLHNLQKYIECDLRERKLIMVKGYHNDFAKGLYAVEAIFNLERLLNSYDILIYSADQEVIEFCDKMNTKSFNSFNVISRGKGGSHESFIPLFGKALISIGNNISDGIPNTLIESIIMGAFPIQSNPGFVSEELIENGINGLLIEDPLDVQEIESLISHAITDKELLQNAFNRNQEIKYNYDYHFIKNQVVEAYNKIKTR